MDTQQTTSSNQPSLQKILISYEEYERLKNIESEYNKLQDQKQKEFEIPSKHHQTGEGSGESSKKAKLSHILEKVESDSDDDSEIYQRIARIVASRIQPPVQTTDLFKTPESSQLMQIQSTSPKTSPPLPFENSIKKNDENDSFGNYFINMKQFSFMNMTLISSRNDSLAIFNFALLLKKE